MLTLSLCRNVQSKDANVLSFAIMNTFTADFLFKARNKKSILVMLCGVF